MLSVHEARALIVAGAEPGPPIAVPLSEAPGLWAAEDLTADVDLPPFDRAAVDGHAARAEDAPPGARLRVLGPEDADGAPLAEVRLLPGECLPVRAGAAMPEGADLVIAADEGRLERGFGDGGELVVTRGGPGRPTSGVLPRGAYLRAGDPLVAAGTRLSLPMMGLLASQGCVHPVCRRRVRVAVVAVGDHLVNPSDAPVMHRERNAAGPSAVIACLLPGATAHDLGVVAERDLPGALARALTAAVVIVPGEPEGAIPEALREAGVVPRFSGVALRPGGSVVYGVAASEDGSPGAHHVFHLPSCPTEVLAAVRLFVSPLIARLHGAPAVPPPPLRALWEGPAPPLNPSDGKVARAVPVRLSVDARARLTAHPLPSRGPGDLAALAPADALALLPPEADAPAFVEVFPFSPWPPEG